MGGTASDFMEYDDYYPVNITFRHNMDQRDRIIWSVVVSAVMITAAGGNLIVIWIVATNPRMRTVTNYFLLNLAVADALIATLSMPFLFSYIVTQNWVMGPFMCRLARFVGTVSTVASVLSLVAVSIDRYRAIVHPLLPRLPKSCIICMIFFIWGGAASFASPLFLYSHLVTFGYLNGPITQCLLIWPDGVMKEYDFWYNVATFTVVYCVPLSILAMCYTVIGVKLWRSGVLGEYIPSRARHIKAKRKVVKMIIVVIAVFATCWLPLHVYQLLPYMNDAAYQRSYSLHVYLAIWTLAMSSSMYNPFIYCWLNERFRAGFKRVFRCGVTSLDDNNGQQPSATPMSPTSQHLMSSTSSYQRAANGKQMLAAKNSLVTASVVDSMEDTC
ncbi:tachykinin-like peptides receptor 99D [Acanthaster planci]|uniref:Tachykinin-like peptides receptor 99D n=1 Tax=Acanthaster planci TaxID=133434 RepID=A0A8B7XH28_ACAPL|nr:tachykinin-like peptides receptor 99D [Acanthaster planci]XP_022079432.1 tachykinin-like peptides receptor 99D [Acanthaster planci]